MKSGHPRPNGLGVTLVPEMALAARVLGRLDLHAAPLEASRRIALAWRRTSGRAETFRRLAALLREAAAPAAKTMGAAI